MENLSLSRFSIANLEKVAKSTLNEASKSGIAEATTHETFTALEDSLSTFSQSLGRKKKSASSPVAQAADRRRDTAWIGLRQMATGATYSPDARVKDKANRVLSVLNHFGAGVEDEALNRETSNLNTILGLLDRPEIMALVVELNLKPYVDELRAANAEFEQADDSREDDVAAFRASSSATHQSKGLATAICSYYDFVCSMAKYNANRAAWAELQRQIYSRYLSTLHREEAAGAAEGTPQTDTE